MNALEDVAGLVIGMVPQWIRGDPGADVGASLSLDGNEFPFRDLGGESSDLSAFKQSMERLASSRATWLQAQQAPSATSYLEEVFAIEWLRLLAPSVDWCKALSYAMRVSADTFENDAITANLVISCTGPGTIDVTEPSLRKLLAPLAGSPQSYFRVNGQLQLLDYRAIRWDEIADSENFKLHPEFLHPFSLLLESKEVSVHHTLDGDLLILKRDGVRAARRKGRWRLYDPAALRQAVGTVLRSYEVGSNVFEFLLDLSFKRHGALLVYDPHHEVHVLNKESIIAPDSGTADELRRFLGERVKGVRMAARDGLAANKSLMIELASMDGAIVFDDDNVRAIGAAIEPHAEARHHPGTRTLAAWSALAWGAYPVKISADGEIDLPFYGERFGLVGEHSLSFL